MRNNETGDVFDVYEVPLHGRLIDADESVKFSVRIIDQAHRFNPEVNKYVNVTYIDDAPTIIPAEEATFEKNSPPSGRGKGGQQLV